MTRLNTRDKKVETTRHPGEGRRLVGTKNINFHLLPDPFAQGHDFLDSDSRLSLTTLDYLARVSLELDVWAAATWPRRRWRRRQDLQ